MVHVFAVCSWGSWFSIGFPRRLEEIMDDRLGFYRLIRDQCIRRGLLSSTDIMTRLETAGQLVEEPGKNKMVCQVGALIFITGLSYIHPQ